MDALEFAKQYKRMCKTYSKKGCQGCPLNDIGCAFMEDNDTDDNFDKIIIDTVEEWATNNLIKGE